jgi:hypothetical protein
VQALITFFAELCLLRRAPQDLPASDALLWVVLVLDLFVGVLVGLSSGLSLGPSLFQGLMELALLLGVLYGGLAFIHHPGRFTQAATALLGSGALIGLLALMPLALNPTGTEDTETAALGALLLLALVAWSILVTGHIVRHTFGITLGQGTAIAVAFEFLAIALISALFGGA